MNYIQNQQFSIPGLQLPAYPGMGGDSLAQLYSLRNGSSGPSVPGLSGAGVTSMPGMNPLLTFGLPVLSGLAPLAMMLFMFRKSPQIVNNVGAQTPQTEQAANAGRVVVPQSTVDAYNNVVESPGRFGRVATALRNPVVSGIFKWGGRALGALGIVFGAIEIAQGVQEGNESKARSGGISAGAGIGAIAGSFVPIPVVGTILGAIVGGAIGWALSSATGGYGAASTAKEKEKETAALSESEKAYDTARKAFNQRVSSYNEGKSEHERVEAFETPENFSRMTPQEQRAFYEQATGLLRQGTRDLARSQAQPQRSQAQNPQDMMNQVLQGLGINSGGSSLPASLYTLGPRSGDNPGSFGLGSFDLSAITRQFNFSQALGAPGSFGGNGLGIPNFGSSNGISGFGSPLAAYGVR